MRFRLFCAATALLTLSNTAFAAEKKSNEIGTAAFPPALSKFVEVNADILKLGEPHGLVMWAVSKRDKTAIVYTTLDGQLLIPGPVFGAKGENLSEPELEAVLRRKGLLASAEGQAPQANASDRAISSAPAPTPAATGEGAGLGAQLLSDFEKSFWIPAGDSRAPVLYMMVDPECGFSRDAWKAIATPYVASGMIQVRLVPVGRIAKDSERLAAHVLGAQDAVGAWNAIAHEEKAAQGWRGVEAQPSAHEAVKSNTAMLDKWATRRVRLELPFFVYRGGDGRVKVVSGVPAAIQTVIADVRGGQQPGEVK